MFRSWTLCVIVVGCLVGGPAADAAEYWIVMKTGNQNGAGTNADVHIKLIGTSGETDWLNLNEKGDDRERGYVNIYVHEARDIGQVKRVQIRTREESRKPDRPDWYLDRVSVHKGSVKKLLAEIMKSKLPVPVPGQLQIDVPAQQMVSLTSNKESQPLRQRFEDAFRKLPGTKEFKFDCWIHPGKHANRGKPNEWTVTDNK